MTQTRKMDEGRDYFLFLFSLYKIIFCAISNRVTWRNRYYNISVR